MTTRTQAAWLTAIAALVAVAGLARVVFHAQHAPPQWQAFFERVLSPYAERRPQSADLFIAALEAALT